MKYELLKGKIWKIEFLPLSNGSENCFEKSLNAKRLVYQINNVLMTK